ncbi:MAG TPA: nucleoside 2-deoxyribosyltransferase [bacterium]|nr:nucleoside 2-deoxyribosyltransferase [bacterium]
MTAPFECEVRLRVPDIDAFHRRLEVLGAVVRQTYAFVDHYWQPAAGPRWDPRARALRLREHLAPEAACEVLLTSIELRHDEGLAFKRSHLPEGKARLYAGPLADCRRLAATLGFVPWISVRKDSGRLFEIPHLGSLVTERVAGLGWMGEIEEEGADPAAAAARIRAKLARLGVGLDQVTGEPVAALVAASAADAEDRAFRLRPGDKVYFCGSIRGGRDRQPTYQAVVEFLQRRGCRVLTAHVAAADVLDRERREGTARDIYARDLCWLAESDAVIAEVSTPSLGVGVEIAEATRLGKPIVACIEAGVDLSAMVAGNPAVRVLRYRAVEELLAALAAVFDGPPGPANDGWTPGGG